MQRLCPIPPPRENERSLSEGGERKRKSRDSEARLEKRTETESVNKQVRGPRQRSGDEMRNCSLS